MQKQKASFGSKKPPIKQIELDMGYSTHQVNSQKQSMIEDQFSETLPGNGNVTSAQ